ncbi:DUF5777 family beta-barrel protein [Pricia sp. S334]|uniref:DUF5777 family beta-barrel protein n=1 Tax=Pricia mediterranea TaxID=3076079 RepID=A0ABU3L5A8_9FLAO|nr:DUF5777 family beta-barrel protein [Pricia sp. S334]MDT7828632.1 DUF5777 family beta-barrel protein [Pricia sp. S334]
MSPIKNNIVLVFLLLCAGVSGSAQDLLQLLNEERPERQSYVEATFKTTRIAYGHSIETRKKGILEIFTANRFWDSPAPRSQSFVADRLSTRFALEYAISDRISTGVGGTTWDGLFDAYLKYRLIRQTAGKQGSPVSVTLLQNASYYSGGNVYSTVADTFDDRLSFTTQALIASKVSRNFSIQLAPTYVHKGLSYYGSPNQDHFAVGVGGRYKLGNHVSVVSEYYWLLNPPESPKTYGPFAVGVNWELGDVMLQFMLTNAVNMVEEAFITGTRNNFNFRSPNLNFGFNFTYVIHFKRNPVK